MATPVYLEIGTKKVFACALDWPGWARAAKTEADALEALALYAGRYRPVAEEAGVRFPKSAGDNLDVVERVKGDTTTDFGAPHVPAGADSTPLTKAQAERLAALVAATWTVFDRVVEASPAELRKGPRGGGRDRDKIVAYVVDAEAAYSRKVGVKDGRDAFLEALRAARVPRPELSTKSWPWRYGARPAATSVDRRRRVPGARKSSTGSLRRARSSRRPSAVVSRPGGRSGSGGSRRGGGPASPRRPRTPGPQQRRRRRPFFGSRAHGDAGVPP